MKWKERLQAARASAPQHHDAQYDDCTRSCYFEALSEPQAKHFASRQKVHEPAAREDSGDCEAHQRCDHADGHGTHRGKAHGELVLGDGIGENEGRQRTGNEPGDEGQHAAVAGMNMLVRT